MNKYFLVFLIFYLLSSKACGSVSFTNGKVLNYEDSINEDCVEINAKCYNRKYRCCRKPATQIFDATFFSTLCRNKARLNFKQITNLQFNYLDVKNYGDFFSNKSHEFNELANASCLAYCGFKDLMMLKCDGSINIESLIVYFGTLAPTVWSKHTMAGISACKEPMSRLTGVNATSIAATSITSCPIAPFMYLQCIQAYLFERCSQVTAASKPPKQKFEHQIIQYSEGVSAFALPSSFT